MPWPRRRAERQPVGSSKTLWLPEERRSASSVCSLAKRSQEEQQQQQQQRVIIIGEDARQALDQGDVYRAFVLLDQGDDDCGGGRSETAFKVSEKTADASPPSSRTHETQTGRNGNTDHADVATTTLNNNNNNPTDPGNAHSRLIDLLWRAGHQEEAVEAFDLARSHARERETEAAGQGRRAPLKPGSGVPGFHLDLAPDICHGIMRAKMLAQDSKAVVEAMRACFCVPRRKVRSYGVVPATVVPGKADLVADEGVSVTEVAGARGRGWAPTEETYAIALEACGRVSVAEEGLGVGACMYARAVILFSRGPRCHTVLSRERGLLSVSMPIVFGLALTTRCMHFCRLFLTCRS